MKILLALLPDKSVLMQSDQRSAPRLSLDRQNVKAVSRPRNSRIAQKISGQASQITPLVLADRLLWQRRHSPAHRACLHFDKRQHLAVVSNEIRFAFNSGNGVVPRDDHVPVPPQIPIRKSLPANPGSSRPKFSINVTSATSAAPRRGKRSLGQ